MAKKITRLKLSMDNADIDRQWKILLGKVSSVLRNSDWTQIDDYNLMETSRSSYESWRDKFRSFKREDFASLDEANKYFQEIVANQPIPEFRKTKSKRVTITEFNKLLRRVEELEKK